MPLGTQQRYWTLKLQGPSLRLRLNALLAGRGRIPGHHLGGSAPAKLVQGPGAWAPEVNEAVATPKDWPYPSQQENLQL